jgi:hypothetical protein
VRRPFSIGVLIIATFIVAQWATFRKPPLPCTVPIAAYVATWVLLFGLQWFCPWVRKRPLWDSLWVFLFVATLFGIIHCVGL